MTNLITNDNLHMTESAIKEQIHAIKIATKNAVQSKETAIKFLTDAGIIEKVNSTGKKLSSEVKKK